jgi:guanylate kinase
MSDPILHDPRSDVPPLVVVLSGPSGVGKTALANRLLASDAALERSVSATTRPPRAGEIDGNDYFFWPEDRFTEGVAGGLFLEWAKVHGHRYGTLKATIENRLAGGKSPVLNIDVQGGRSVKLLRPDAVLIFILPPSYEVLERRLRGRGTDPDPVIARRLRNAKGEIEHWIDYDYLVVNDTLDEAVGRVRAILTAERSRVVRFRS